MTGLGMAALAIGANLPDIDAFAVFFGTHALSVRRGWTHGPIALLVLPALLTLALVTLDNVQLRRNTRPLDRPVVRPAQLLLLAFIGCVTHPLLDWMNTYGVRLLMPFSERWFYGDALQIIDPWIWIALGLGYFISRRRHRANTTRAARPARTALVAVVAYIAAMIVGSRVARERVVREASAQGVVPVRVMAGPVFFNPTRRRIIVDEGNLYAFGTLDWTPRAVLEFDPIPLPQNGGHPLAVAARGIPDVRRFLSWSRFPYFVIPVDTVDGELELGDARFRERRGPLRTPFHMAIPVRQLRDSE